LTINYSFWRRNLSHNSISCQIPSVSSEELALSVSSAVNCPDFAATVTAFSYLCRIKRKEISSCSACGHPLQDLTHLLLDCLASEPFRRAIFNTTSSVLISVPDLGGVPRLLGLRGIFPRPHPSEGVGSTTTTLCLCICYYLKRNKIQIYYFCFIRTAPL